MLFISRLLFFFTKVRGKNNNNNNNKTYDGMKTGKKTREIKIGKTPCRNRCYRKTCKNAKYLTHAKKKTHTKFVCENFKHGE